jgi:uncharacterized membrane protein YfcA
VELNLATLALLVTAGAGTGVLGAVLGTGGGVFLIPILVLGLDVSMHEAVATSIVSVIATSSAVSSGNVERGMANIRLGMTLEIATSLGAIAGGLTAAWLAPQALEALFAIALLPTAALMWRSALRGPRFSAPAAAATAVAPDEATNQAAPSALEGRYFDPSLGYEVAYRVRQLWAALGISLLAGNLSGLLGIGGGVFKVPALHLLCGMPIKAAAATSNFMIGVTATASAFLYFGRDEVLPELTAAVVLGVLVGSAAGFALSGRVGGQSVKRLFAVLLAVVAIQMLVRAWMHGG